MNDAPVRSVRCPRCGASARYAPDNPWRPFCSERCRSHDLGAWAAERFRIDGAAPESSDASDVSAAPAAPPRDD